MIAADIVIFSIRSTIKLGQQMRRSYVDATKKRDLILPLPDFFKSSDIISALNYFNVTGKGYVAKVPRLAQLIKNYTDAGLTDIEENELVLFHKEFKNFDSVKVGKLGAASDGSILINSEEFEALITYRQWKRDKDPNPSTLQRFAGTFIEIGVDYFVSVPGALNKDSRESKALYGFLEAMNEIHFSEFQLKKVPGRLFTAAIETISNTPELLTADEKVQELIKVTTKSISINVANRIKELDEAGGNDLVKEERIVGWAELVFRSLLSSAGELVLSNPKKFLDVESDGKAALVSQVGDSVLGLVLDDSSLRLDRLFSREGLDKITKSALVVVGEHPEILRLSSSKGLQQLLSQIATDLSRYDTLYIPGILPEITRLILNKTGKNLELLWPDLASSPQSHLLLTAASTTLSILTSAPENDQKWKLRFSRAEILAITEAVFDELVANPTWLLDEAGKINENLKIALEASVDILRNRADERLNTSTAIEVLRVAIFTVSTRKEFLDKMPAGTPHQGQPIIAAAIDVVFAAIFDDELDTRAAWQVLRTDTIVAFTTIVLTELSKVKLSADSVSKLSEVVKKQIEHLAAGESLDLHSVESELKKILDES